MVRTSAATVVVALAVMAASADAHSKMILPKPTFLYGESDTGTNSPAGTVDTSVLPVPDGMSYSGDPLSNTEAYWTAFNASDYTSLKELVFANEEVATSDVYGTATIECGYSLVNGTARDLPDEVEWDQLTTGHDGPFEIWCDDTLVFSDPNAAVDYTGNPATFPYDKDACEGASMLTAIWMALHSPPWQVFTNCAPLTGSTASSSSSSTTTTTTTTTAPTATTATPTATTATSSESSTAADYDSSASTETTAAPATTTAAPATTTAAPTATTEAPAATTEAPAATTEAPTATTAATDAPAATTAEVKCNARRNRD